MNTLFWFVSWMVVGLLVGILGFFIGGLIAASAHEDGKNRYANYYSKIAMKLLGRAALVEAGVKYDIYRSTNFADTNSDTIEIDGEDAQVTNIAGFLSTLHRQPFGIVPPPEDNVAEYVTPELAELGKLEKERVEHDAHLDGKGRYESSVSLSQARPTGKLREYAAFLIPGSRSVWDLSETIELYKQSQSMFGESRTTQFMILILAYGGAALLTWLILTNAGGAVPKHLNLPLVIRL